RELQWSDLIPVGAPLPDLEPMPLHDLSDLGDVLSEDGPPAPQQAPNEPVVEALDGQRVKLPGYVVPLDITDEGRVIEFLLVPYFGACIHVPPPPSNQIVHATSELGVRVEALYEPFWIEGPLRVEHASSELAEAGYRMQAQKIYPYESPYAYVLRALSVRAGDPLLTLETELPFRPLAPFAHATTFAAGPLGLLQRVKPGLPTSLFQLELRHIHPELRAAGLS